MNYQIFMGKQLLYDFNPDTRVLGVSIHPSEIAQFVKTRRTNDSAMTSIDLSLPNPHNPDDHYKFMDVTSVVSITPKGDLGEDYLLHAKRAYQESDSSRRSGFRGLFRKLIHPPTNER